MLEIVRVETKKQMRDFVKFPFSLYKGNPYWVPPMLSDEYFTLDKTKNPAFDFSDACYWLALKDGKVVGRIAGIISHAYIEKWGNRYARFGWFDFIDDMAVSKALMETVENWAREHELIAVHGPLGFCDLDKEGMLVEGFQEMGSFITLYNHTYYPKHVEALGYAKDAEWIEWDITLPDHDPSDKISKLAQRAMERYKLHTVELKKTKDVLPYVPAVFDLLNIGYEHLYGVVPITRKQVDIYVKQFFSFVNPKFISLVLNDQDEIVGFGINIPSLAKASQKAQGRMFPFGFIHYLRANQKNDVLDLYLVAIRPELKATGVPFIMLDMLTKNAKEAGIRHAIASPELETNTAVHSMWRNYDTRIHRRRRAYKKML